MPLGQRVDYYKRLDVEAVIGNLLPRTGKIDPIFDLDAGYRYPEVENLTKRDTKGSLELLDELYEAKILDREIHDMEIRCPDCTSPNISTRYLCPMCNSFHIKKTILLEHFECGYLGPLVTFGEPRICPKCNQPLVDGSYRNAGSIYECADCKKQIDTPFVNHWCRTKGYIFSFENAIYQPKFSYFATPETRADMERGIVFLSPVIGIFEGLGMKRVDNTRVVGTSGVEQIFDACFEGGGRRNYIDIIQGMDRLGELDILREYGKVVDSRVDAWVLVSPGLEDKALALSKSYKMNVLDGAKPDEIYNKLGVALRERGLTSQTTLESAKDASQEQAKPEEKPKSRWRI